MGLTGNSHRGKESEGSRVCLPCNASGWTRSGLGARESTSWNLFHHWAALSWRGAARSPPPSRPCPSLEHVGWWETQKGHQPCLGKQPQLWDGFLLVRDRVSCISFCCNKLQTVFSVFLGFQETTPKRWQDVFVTLIDSSNLRAGLSEL